MTPIDADRVATLTARESEEFAQRHPRCEAGHRRARGSMPDGVPMSWMAKWAGPFPLTVGTPSACRARARSLSDRCPSGSIRLSNGAKAITCSPARRVTAARAIAQCSGLPV